MIAWAFLDERQSRYVSVHVTLYQYSMLLYIVIIKKIDDVSYPTYSVTTQHPDRHGCRPEVVG